MIIKFIKSLPQWLFTIVTAIAIFYLTIAPHPLPDNEIRWWQHSDKVVHAIMFGALYFAFYFDYVRKSGHDKWKSVTTIYTVAAVALFGALIEVAQSSMGLGRSGDVIDFLADCGGTIVAAIIAPRIFNRIS
ncbi:MAG: VanZ family protein [Muribaculaceae bacterium]|nr:VanZ family protein [Muribaculaceae bacterium]